MLKSVLLLSAAACLLAGCGPSAGTDAATSESAAKAESADSQGASDGAACKLFTAAEIEKFTGEPMNGGQTAGPGGSACQWIAKDDDGDAMLQIVSADYADNPTLAEGYKEVPAIGEKAYVAKDFGGLSPAQSRARTS